MTVITADTSVVEFTSPNQTIVIVPGVTAGTVQALTGDTGSLLVNYGRVLNPSTYAVLLGEASGQTVNKPGGVISGALGGIRVSEDGDVDNQGVIFGAGEDGVQFVVAANNNTLTNSGDIYGFLGGVTVSASTATNIRIVNSGEITSDGHGIWLLNVVGAAPVIVNTGTISGRTDAILAEAGDRLNLTNSGRLLGDVNATSAGQSDSVTNNGTISGNVKLGSGNDSYKGTGSVSGTVFGEDGTDTLAGGSAADKLNGGVSNDVLTGGLGKDLLTGGLDADRFDFNSKSESVKGTNRDQILDFNRGQGDKIDLVTIDADTSGNAGNDKFAFIGKDGFNGGGGELRYIDKGAFCIAQGDINGDKVADFEIRVNIGSLNGGDFFL